MRQPFELGMTCRAVPGHMARFASAAEDAGFDVLLCSDTQNLAPEVYGPLTEAALATRTIRLGPGVTNPVTRHAAVTASAMAALQVTSAGRAVCGIGRGDSATVHAGMQPATVAATRRYVEDLRMYWGRCEASGVPARYPLQWFAEAGVAAPALDVACTGPKVIALAADCADSVTFTVGADPSRVRWALDVLNERLDSIGRPRDSLRVGAYVNAVVADDLATAVALARPGVGVLAHFPSTPGGDVDGLPARHKSLALHLREHYDMSRHGGPAAAHLEAVDDGFVEWFAIVGDAARCRERVRALLDLGLDHLYLVGPTVPSADLEQRVASLVEANSRFAREVVAAALGTGRPG